MQRKAPRRRRIRSVRVDQLLPGDVLWSDATMRELMVIAVAQLRVRADGNVYDEHDIDDEGDEEMTTAYAISVRSRAGDVQRLGAYAPHAKVQVLR